MMKSANELMFQALLTDPEKRKKVLELLTTEGLVPPSESTAGDSRSNTPTSRHNRIDDLTRSPLIQLLSPKHNSVKKKRLIESPSAQFRRRCLQKLESDSSIESSAEDRLLCPTSGGTPVPFHQLLKGVIAYCEVRSKEGDRSSGIKAVMKAMGATVRDNFTRDLTHVVFKDGLFSTFQKAKLLKIHLVSVLWLEAIRRHKYRVPETKYPALGVEAYDANVTAICQALQQDYEDVVQDEYRRRSEIKHNTSVSSENNFVTRRPKKSFAPESKTSEFENMSDAAQLTGSISSANRTRPDTPESASPMSVMSNKESCMDDVVPCSQDGPSSLSHSHNKSRMLLLMTDDESSENIVSGQSNIARHVKDSFELKRSLKIRSPESLLGRKLASKSLDENRNSLEDELSMRLHITTDESNINSTGSKSRSSSLNAQTEIGSKSASDLNESKKPKRKYVRRMTLGATGTNSVKSVTDLEDSKKTKASTSSMMDKPCDSSNSSTGNKEGKETELSATPNINKTKNRRTTRFGTNISTAASDNIEIEGTIISELTKSKPNIQNEHVSAEPEKLCSPNKNKNVAKDDSDNQNKGENTDKQPIVKPRLRKLYKENFDDLRRFNFLDQPAKSDEQNENEPVKSKRKYCVQLPAGFELTKTLSNKARAASVKKTATPKNTGAIKKTRQSVTKLVFTSSSSDDNHGRNISIGSDEIFQPNVEPSKTRKSPRRIIEANKQVIEIDPIITAKKQSPQKRTLNSKAISELASDSEDAFKTASSKKKRRNSVTTISSTDNDDETDSDDSDRSKQSCVTPRRSMRLNASKISNLDDNPQTPGSAVRRSTRRTICNPEPTKTPSRTPNLRKQVLTSKTPKKPGSSSDEIKEKSERRSTLEFVQRPSRKSLERIKLTQKSKHVIKLCSIVCTRLHKGDVQVFQQIVKKLGGFVIEDEVTERTTHLVAGAASRTINMLRAITRGCWIVRQEWLFKSLEAGKWLEEEEFELIEFSPAVQKCRLQRKSFGPLYSLDIFKECGPIHVCKSSNPRCSDLEELLSLCGGNVVKTPRLAKIIVGDYFRYDNTFCVNEKWILDCITHNRKKSVKGYLLEPRYSSSSQ